MATESAKQCDLNIEHVLEHWHRGVRWYTPSQTHACSYLSR